MVQGRKRVIRIVHGQITEGGGRSRHLVGHQTVSGPVFFEGRVLPQTRAVQGLKNLQRLTLPLEKQAADRARLGFGAATQVVSETQMRVPICLLTLSKREAVLTGSPSAR
jgi:hypothetical protein